MSYRFKTSSQLKENIKCAYLATNLPSFISIQTTVLFSQGICFDIQVTFILALKSLQLRIIINNWHSLSET